MERSRRGEKARLHRALSRPPGPARPAAHVPYNRPESLARSMPDREEHVGRGEGDAAPHPATHPMSTLLGSHGPGFTKPAPSDPGHAVG
jgi:hypothetical protein